MRRSRKRHSLVFAAMAALAALLPAARSAPVAACDPAPVLRSLTINQGVGEYVLLVRGKEALVRADLTRPSCSSSSTSVVPTGTTLQGRVTLLDGVTPADPAAPTFTVSTPHAPTADTAIPGWTATLPGNHAGWPLFVIPASVLDPTAPGDFLVTLTSLTVTYRIGGTTSSRTYSTPESGRMSVKVTTTGVPTVLVVPMGNATAPGGLAAEYTAADHALAVGGVETLGRVLPVRDRVAPLCEPGTGVGEAPCVPTFDGGGLRWHRNPTMLNLGPTTGTTPGLDTIPPGEEYCLHSSVTPTGTKTVAGLLAMLAAWNARNPTARADTVVGVISGHASYGIGNPVPGTNSGCGSPEGWAFLESPVAWLRLTPPVSGNNGYDTQAGALMAHEYAHTLRLVPEHRDDPHDLKHAPYDVPGVPVASADRGSNHAFHVPRRQWLADDRNLTKYEQPWRGWTNHTVLFEPIDWSSAVCSLGGTPSTQQTAYEETCVNPAFRADHGVQAAGAVFHLVGSTDGTSSGTSVLYAGAEPGGARAAGQPSGYRLVQFDLRDGVVVQRLEHELPVLTQAAHSEPCVTFAGAPCGAFDVSVPVTPPVEGAARLYRIERDGVVLATVPA